MSKLDLRHLRSFKVIAEEGNLSKAADALFLSQPAVSAQLKSLEDTIGLRLFDRGARGMTLTSSGALLLEEAEKALAAADAVMDVASSLRVKKHSPEIRLGTISDPRILRLADISESMKEASFDLKLSFSQGISGSVIKRVLSGDLDAGFVVGIPNNGEIIALKIFPIKLTIVAPPKWSERIRSATWEDIARMPWISTPEDCSYREIATRMFQSFGIKPEVVVEADQEGTLIDLVSKSVGLTLIRDDIANIAEIGGSAVIWPQGIANDHVYFVYRRAQNHSHIMDRLIFTVRELWGLSKD